MRADSARKEADDMAVAVAPAPAPIDTLDHPQLSDVHVDPETAFELLCLLEAATHVIDMLSGGCGAQTPLVEFFVSRTLEREDMLFPYEPDEAFEDRFDVWSRTTHKEAFHVLGLELAAEAFSREAADPCGLNGGEAADLSVDLKLAALGERQRFAAGQAEVSR